ncbi:MAG: hypothetical protein ThorAB25_04970 [Candidatus Thorarchaeota archaeon AB_25]|nr:MAG: hypothetical protein ThorAB25_04970 [Candidatus Thorarchaeota archaeon AB_25]
MVEKKFTDRLRVHVPLHELRFNEHEFGISAEFDKHLLQKHLPRTQGIVKGDITLANTLSAVMPDATREALRETDFVGVFGRVVRQKGSGGGVCLQYFYVWDYQAVPAHEADYEPIFVYLDGPRKYAIYDLVHYCSRRVNLSPKKAFRMIPGWHSFLPTELKDSQIDKGLEVQPLSDAHLHSWWSIPNEEARLKVEGFIRDPFMLAAPGHFMDQPDENAQTMCCSFLQIERALSEFEDPRKGIVEGVKRAFSNCVGLLALYRLGAYLQLLGEMNDIGMVNIPVSLSSINIATFGKILQDGFVSLTKAGKKILDGVQPPDPDE